MRELRVGLIGTGFIGRVHASAFTAAPGIFGAEPARLKLEMVADLSADLARSTAEDFGFARWTTDWRDIVQDPDIDVVDITTPNNLHHEMAILAAQMGKHIYCEKPLALDATQAREMTEAAEAAGVVTLVGFNYVQNPVHALAKELIEGGDFGEIFHFRGTFDQDYMLDPQFPFTWRCDKVIAGSGVAGDLASHVISLAQYLVGDIVEVAGRVRVLVTERPVSVGGLGLDADAARNAGMRAVDTDDMAQFLCVFANGASGSIEVSRVATGRKWWLSYEIQGTKGALFFTHERLNELRYYQTNDAAPIRGYKTIQLGPEHKDYAAFSPVAGSSLGNWDLKIIEVRRLLEAIAANRPAYPNFRAALQVSSVVDAVLRSADERRWVKVSRYPP